jgi:retinol dehydrogenase 12
MATEGISFNPQTDIPSLEGKLIFITGANTGLGKQSALDLAKHGPAQIWMTARNVEKGMVAVDEVRKQSPGVDVNLLPLDLTSFNSIKAAAKEFVASASRLDVLFLNGGILGHAPAVTKEGYEIHMGTNHVGHALLLQMLTPLLLKTAAATSAADVRVVILTSRGYASSQGIVFANLKCADGETSVRRYCDSKLANLLYAQEVVKHYPQFTTVSVHPGEVKTELFSREAGDDMVPPLANQNCTDRGKYGGARRGEEPALGRDCQGSGERDIL